MRLLIVGFSFLLLVACTIAPKGVWHTVAEGQTLYRISRDYGINEIYLARINGINDPKRLQPGERIFIPGKTNVKNVPATDLRPAPKEAYKKPSSFSSRENETRKNAVVPASAGKFAWPLKGEVIRKFGSGVKSQSKGIEISAPPETPVHAAASGRVIYSGDGIKGFGNLIILKHGNAFYSVYGFNQKNLVQVGTMVEQGRPIALSGAAPGGGEPKLHFEIRQGKKAVDPLSHLP
ncbi:MAG: peptidoglycan DD-metalloendopeptidase family protein [Desulfuromonadales bacterium]|nr:peptidoglycan DD-metalloendopeptidase family protein [Desulfuromonadales bacterium]MDT8422320.1 peptidoglycan DD-metalloendopeptidase family protein [Desulfuromonadales bacterium]